MSTYKYDRLPEAGQRLARIPRYGRLLARLPEERFDKLRNESTALWEAYMYVDPDRNETGLFDDGLKPRRARRLGCHAKPFPNFEAPTTRHWQVRLACDLTAAIAFEMTFGEETPRTAVRNVDGLLQQVRTRRLKPTGAYADIDGEPVPLTHFKGRDWPRLQAMNTRGLSFLLFNDTSAELRFTDRTTQMFFAACWIARWGTEEDRALIHRRIPLHGEGSEQDPNQQYLDFWQLLAELPTESTCNLDGEEDGERWVRAVAPLFRPGDGTAEGTRRNCELIHRAWGTLEAFAAPARGAEGERPRGPVAIASPAELAWGTLVAFQAEFAEQCLSGERGADDREVAAEFIAGFQPIPPGEFLKSPPWVADRRENERQQRVRLTRAFELHQYQTTNAVFRLFMPGHDPGSYFRRHRQDRPRQPVVMVDWYESWCFAKWACWEGRSCRLPTQAEWEYACWAGEPTPFHFGTMSFGTQSNIEGNYLNGTKQTESYLQRTSDVGDYSANAFELHDIPVCEWCADWYGAYPQVEVVVDPEGPRSGLARVSRGVRWFGVARRVPATIQSGFPPVTRYVLGIRVARSS